MTNLSKPALLAVLPFVMLGGVIGGIYFGCLVAWSEWKKIFDGSSSGNP